MRTATEMKALSDQQALVDQVLFLQNTHALMAKMCLTLALFVVCIYLVIHLITNATNDANEATNGLVRSMVNITFNAFLMFLVWVESTLILDGKFDFLMPVEQKVALFFGCVYLFIESLRNVLDCFERPYSILRAAIVAKFAKTKNGVPPKWIAGDIQSGKRLY